MPHGNFEAQPNGRTTGATKVPDRVMDYPAKTVENVI